MKFAKFLRTYFLQNTSGGLLLENHYSIQISVHEGVETDTENLHVPGDITDVVKYIETYMNKIETKPSIVEECLYTVSVSLFVGIAVCCYEF